jgi:hypothetical protein
MTDKKIVELLDEIQSSILNDFTFKMNEVLSFCDSQIEKLFILKLFYYFKTHKESLDWMNEYEIEFIEDYIFLQDYSCDNDKKFLKELIAKYSYRNNSSCYLKYNGLRIKENFSEPGSSVFRKFEVFPNSNTIIDGKKYILDIAIIMYRIKDQEVIETKRIALECDGYDYHSSPIQKRNDDIRTRKLKQKGWREVLRYSGTEIYHLKDANIDQIFKEIIQVMMI